MGRLNGLYLFIEKVYNDGVDIPNDKKQGGVLNIPPTRLFDQTRPPEPVNQKHHRKDEKKMGKLVNPYPLNTGVSLGREN
jgi:hypothetical protein